MQATNRLADPTTSSNHTPKNKTLKTIFPHEAPPYHPHTSSQTPLSTPSFVLPQTHQGITMPSQTSQFHLRVPQDPTASADTSKLHGVKLKERDLGRVSSPKGTLPFLKPTHAYLHVAGQKLDWNSRDHRKGRHPLQHGQRRRISTFLKLEWWNISWWVAVVCPPRTPFFCLGLLDMC